MALADLFNAQLAQIDQQMAALMVRIEALRKQMQAQPGVSKVLGHVVQRPAWGQTAQPNAQNLVNAAQNNAIRRELEVLTLQLKGLQDKRQQLLLQMKNLSSH